MRRLLAPLVLAVLVACGGDGGVGETVSARLTPHVAALRAAAADGQSIAAYEQLSALRNSVAELRRAGELSDSEAAQVLAASARVEAELAALAPPAGTDTAGTQATTTTTVGEGATTTLSDEERKPKKDGDERGKGGAGRGSGAGKED